MAKLAWVKERIKSWKPDPDLTFLEPWTDLTLTLVMIGGMGAQSAPSPLFLFVKTIEKVIRLYTVLKKKLSGSFENKAIFHVIQIDR